MRADLRTRKGLVEERALAQSGYRPPHDREPFGFFDAAAQPQIQGIKGAGVRTGEFVLGSTFERIAVPNDLVARIEGKSSLGRLGLLIHSTAGFIDAGFDGHITLELSNVASLPITIYPGMKIGQLSFMQMTTPAENPYGGGARGSKYQGQRGVTLPRA